jgi:hypothetical protein
LNMPAPSFDQLFDSLVEGSVTSDPSVARDPSPEQRNGGQDLDERVARAMVCFHRGEYSRCYALLQDCAADSSRDPRIRAFLAASRSLINGRVREGVGACVEAIRAAFYIPDLYCALGVLLLRTGDRAKAFAAFQRGLRLDPRHRTLRTRVREMGERRPPVVRFLGRSHPANRVLGMLRARLLPA